MSKMAALSHLWCLCQQIEEQMQRRRRELDIDEPHHTCMLFFEEYESGWSQQIDLLNSEGASTDQ